MLVEEGVGVDDVGVGAVGGDPELVEGGVVLGGGVPLEAGDVLVEPEPPVEPPPEEGSTTAVCVSVGVDAQRVEPEEEYA